MQGFAVIDHQPGSETLAVWVTSRVEPQRAAHVNAVSIDLVHDPLALEKVRSLTRGRAVLCTDGSRMDGLPLEGDSLTVEDLDGLVTETEEQQTLIVEAVATYGSKTGNRKLVTPDFAATPTWKTSQHSQRPAHTATQRALETANYLARAWTAWLATDEERRRRSVQPRTNMTPWIMPQGMSSPELATFPPSFAQRVHAQPSV